MKRSGKTIAIWAGYVFWASLAVLTVSSLFYSAIGLKTSAFLQMVSLIVGSVAFFVFLMTGGLRTNEEYLEYLEQRKKRKRSRRR